MQQIKVLIIDDSQLVRQLLTRLLSSDPQLSVVGAAKDPYEARQMIKQLNPDVLTLDVEMPRMNGIAFLKNLMRLRPMPVVMISTLTEQGADVTLQALELGAVDYIAKPKLDLEANLQPLALAICHKVRQAATANIKALEPPAPQTVCQPHTERNAVDCQLIAIGASTGGTEAIKHLLCRLPQNMPPIMIVQHMPAGFTASYANRLDRSLPLKVQELSRSRTPLQAGHVYIAYGDAHLEVKRGAQQLYGMVREGEPVSQHKPSVDVLFASAAEQLGQLAVGVILTGMGRDGAAGLKQMRAQQSLTLAQDQASSVVWGMPRAAVEMEAVEQILPLCKIAERLVNHCYRRQTADLP